MSGMVSGIIGGAIAMALTAYMAKKVGRQGDPGQLRFGAFIWILGGACLLLAGLPVGVTVFAGDEEELVAKGALFVGFGLGAVYLFGEAAFVRGTFDEEGIDFYTPWTGRNQEKWNDLESVKFNGWMSWYTLKFRSGNKIRLSRFMWGHLSAPDMAGATN